MPPPSAIGFGVADAGLSAALVTPVRLCLLVLASRGIETGHSQSGPVSVAEGAAAVMEDLVGRQLFQGAVVIGRGGVVQYSEGFGFADLERRVPFTPDTPTDGGSMAKTFTAAALLLLAAEGRVDLEAPVRDILPSFPHAATRVRHLLAHSAGLPGFDWLDARVTAGEVRTNASHVALVARDAPAPAFVPGSGFGYDNVAYDVAAMVVERLAGMSFADFLAQRFARPLGLEAFLRPARFADWTGVRTRGYQRSDSGWTEHDAYDLEGFYGASNVYLSARDLHDWVAGYRRVVGPDVSRAAVTPARLDDGRSTGIGLGSWYVSKDRRRYYTGDLNGFYSFAYADDARGLAVAWVANDGPPPWVQSGLARALIAVAEGRRPERVVPPPAVAPAPDPTGAYRVPAVGTVVVRRDGPRILARVDAVEYDAFPLGDNVQFVPGLDAYLRFSLGADGRVTLSWDSVFAVATAVPRLPAVR